MLLHYFLDLNKVCPKDEFPSNTDMSPLDTQCAPLYGFNAYNQIKIICMM